MLLLSEVNDVFFIFCGDFQVKILGNDDGTGTLQRVSIKLRIQVSPFFSFLRVKPSPSRIARIHLERF